MTSKAPANTARSPRSIGLRRLHDNIAKRMSVYRSDDVCDVGRKKVDEAA